MNRIILFSSIILLSMTAIAKSGDSQYNKEIKEIQTNRVLGQQYMHWKMLYAGKYCNPYTDDARQAINNWVLHDKEISLSKVISITRHYQSVEDEINTKGGCGSEALKPLMQNLRQMSDINYKAALMAEHYFFENGGYNNNRDTNMSPIGKALNTLSGQAAGVNVSDREIKAAAEGKRLMNSLNQKSRADHEALAMAKYLAKRRLQQPSPTLSLVSNEINSSLDYLKYTFAGFGKDTDKDLKVYLKGYWKREHVPQARDNEPESYTIKRNLRAKTNTPTTKCQQIVNHPRALPENLKDKLPREAIYEAGDGSFYLKANLVSQWRSKNEILLSKRSHNKDKSSNYWYGPIENPKKQSNNKASFHIADNSPQFTMTVISQHAFDLEFKAPLNERHRYFRCTPE